MPRQHRHSPAVYGLLILTALFAATGLAYEHTRTVKREQQAVLDRAGYIAVAVSTVIRSQTSAFSGIVWQPRLEAVLKELIDAQADLSSVTLFNTDNEVVASAGPAIDFSHGELAQLGYHWGEEHVTIVKVVALGDLDSGPDQRPIIVVGEDGLDEFGERSGRGGPPGPPGSGNMGGPPPMGPPPMGPPRSRGEGEGPDAGPPRPGDLREGDGGDDEDRRGRRDWRWEDRDENERDDGGRRRGGPPRDFRGDGPDDGFRSDPRRGRSVPWSWWRGAEAERERLLREGGVHGFVVNLSTQEFREAITRDKRLRLSVGAIVALALLGIGVAWHNFSKSSELQIRLLRAGEMNLHLREMNLAAAGLAHETRNPLNIIRGLAQLISREEVLGTETRARSRDIADEVDRVTNRLNQFIDYSRPPEPRPVKTAILDIARDVARTLDTDREDKNLRILVEEPGLHVLADESLLRQVFFNLMLNAIQALHDGGRITVSVSREGKEEACLLVCDNGPGVAESNREDIFRPYFTTNSNGTGLGLAVVRQLVLAHQWEISCGARPDGQSGACFRIHGIRLA